ncbi:hypothetical protein P154DRAFT_516920 [Amniculicola lignicola CBS 123094]|uniref:Uncharacterized protein n=1 Tax=Amniculicola lignicola CBS 123094 TaxID=1392246 RepID=A0A6A5X5Z2_9PLEO|nr:hypothetical protein P154DRAFT_516920 [Amniculicola lignicola CBS 123094]
MSGAYNGPSSGLKTSFPSTVPRLKPFTSSLRDVSRSQASAPINVPRRQPSTASLSSAPRRDFTSKYSNSVLRHRASMNYASGSLRAQAMLLKVDTHHGPRLGGIPSDDDEAFAHYKSEMKEKPVRQPRNPPLLDELEAAPTLKHKGSRNFMRWGGK